MILHYDLVLGWLLSYTISAQTGPSLGAEPSVVFGFALVIGIFGYFAFKYLRGDDTNGGHSPETESPVQDVSNTTRTKKSVDPTTSGTGTPPSDSGSPRGREVSRPESPTTPSESVETSNEKTNREDAPNRIPEAPALDIEYNGIDRGEKIGHGGTADVYRGRVTVGEEIHDLALKEPRVSGTLHTDTVDRFVNEAQNWARLDDHDHIVGVIGYGSAPLPWIAMEYMDGGHAGDRLGTLDLEEALWIARCTGEAIHYAHRRGVAHLDLKPENVLFRTVDGAWDVPKIVDLGLSKQLLAQSETKGLSPPYAAPEQFDESRGPADDLTDIYQLGALTYALITDEPPYSDDSMEAMRSIPTEPPPRPTQVDPSLPAALDDVLTTAMAEDRQERHRTAAHLVEDLSDVLDIHS